MVITFLEKMLKLKKIVFSLWFIWAAISTVLIADIPARSLRPDLIIKFIQMIPNTMSPSGKFNQNEISSYNPYQFSFPGLPWPSISPAPDKHNLSSPVNSYPLVHLIHDRVSSSLPRLQDAHQQYMLTSVSVHVYRVVSIHSSLHC